nr:MAG: hypothetical protein 3 [Solemoviridae sp.]
MPEDPLSYENFRAVVRNLNFDASVGFPYCRIYANLGEVFQWDGVNLDEPSVQLWYRLFLKWLEEPIAYPFRVFIKDELVKKEKFDQGRLRLIFVSPLFNQLLDHLLFDIPNKLEQEYAWEIPTKLGWQPFWGGAEKLVSNFDDPVSLDKSMWDWTVSWELLEIDKEFRKRNVLNLTEEVSKLIDLSYDLAFKNSSMFFSSGHCLQQNFNGLMKSGLVNTLSTNSHLQVVIHLLSSTCGHHYKMWCIGDDVVMTRPCQEYRKNLEKYCLIKEFEEGYLFAGFDCYDKVPLYWSKHVNNLLYAKEEDLAELLEAYQRLYVFDKEKLSIIQELLGQLEPRLVKSPSYLKFWAVFSMNLEKYKYRVFM